MTSALSAPCDPLTGLRIPKVYLIGSAKAGTTYLASLLWQHPKVHLAKPKEPEFFSFDENYSKGLSWYAKIYQQSPPEHLLIDGSTGYTRYPEYPHAAERLHLHAPDAKLIYLMRHPVDRAFSHFIHRWTKELHWNEPFSVPFEKHIQTDTMCINSSDYRLQLQQYLKRFSEDSILCLFSHDLKHDQSNVLKRICKFLDLAYDPSHFPPPIGRDNDSSAFLESRVRLAITNRIKSAPLIGSAVKWLPAPIRESGYRLIRRSSLAQSARTAFDPPPMKPETRSQLIERFRESNEWISQFTGKNLECWNN